jgi:DNA ligase-1
MNTDHMQHGYTWHGQDVSGWIASEKYDGIRAYWDGETMWTRGGNAVPIPQEWRDALPAGVHLDGEIFAGYGQRKKAEWFARAGKYTEECTYRVFDAPSMPGCYADRMDYVEKVWNEDYTLERIGGIPTARWSQVEWWTIDGIESARNDVAEIQAEGGEGLILRHPDLAYTPGRTDRLLKLKTWEIN